MKTVGLSAILQADINKRAVKELTGSSVAFEGHFKLLLNATAIYTEKL